MVTITDLQATNTNLTVVLTSTVSAPASGVLTLTDSTTQDITSGAFTPTANANEYTAVIAGDYSDGVFTMEVEDTAENSDSKTVGKLSLGVLALLSMVYAETFDPYLLAKIEATKFQLVNENGDAAREIYYGVQMSYGHCVDDTVEPTLEGISVWVVDDNFVVQ